MREVNVIPGLAYAVTATNDCSVLLPSGVPMLSIAAGTQDIVVAQAGKLLVSDDAALVTEVRNPKWLAERNPKWLAELRTELDGLLDGSAYELAWMPKGEKLVVHTDRVADDLLEQVRTTAEAYLPAGEELVQYNHHIEVSWWDIPPGIPSDWINKYDKCVTQDDLVSVDNRWKYDTLTISGVKDWFSKRYPECSAFLQNDNLYLHTFSKLTNADFRNMGSTNVTWLWCPELTHMDSSWFGYTSAQFTYIYAPKATLVYLNGMAGFDGCFTSATRVQYQSQVNGNAEAECYAEFPSLSEGIFYTSWTQTKFSKKSVLRILGSIPSYSSGNHKLYIGIHINHQNDEEVLAAIANAEAKGWTLTVQWNGTATAAASVMRFGQLIYAKVGGIEMPDGTTERVLDWGHYVTDETGYETFRSLESAYEYFGLPMPEEA